MRISDWSSDVCSSDLGAALRGRPVGSFGDASAFSYCTDKIISTGGEGGMLLFREEAPWELAWSYKDHGKNRRSVESPASVNAFRWLHDSFGTNFRLTEMPAAIGLQQPGKLPQCIAARRRKVALMKSATGGLLNRRVVDHPESGP